MNSAQESLPPRAETLAGRLARTLIVWVGGVWLACVLAVVWYVDSEINHNFDSELVEVSHRLFDIALLEGDEIDIAGISGTSAGALNGAAVTAGLGAPA